MSRSERDEESALAPSGHARTRWRVGLGAAVVLLIVGVGVAVVAGLATPGGGVQPVSALAAPSDAPFTAAPTASTGTMLIHVLGQVKRPGVYELATGTRVVDAVGAAGGFTAAADQGALNLARLLVDGEQIVVPKPGEVPLQPAGGPQNGPSTGAAGKVDLNSATLEQLQALPHIGPALAQRILDWRAQNGRFASVDDLKNVAGIGDKTFADLAEFVTAG